MYVCGLILLEILLDRFLDIGASPSKSLVRDTQKLLANGNIERHAFRILLTGRTLFPVLIQRRFASGNICNARLVKPQSEHTIGH
jgi:hypothetical protein